MHLGTLQRRLEEECAPAPRSLYLRLEQLLRRRAALWLKIALSADFTRGLCLCTAQFSVVGGPTLFDFPAAGSLLSKCLALALLLLLLTNEGPDRADLLMAVLLEVKAKLFGASKLH